MDTTGLLVDTLQEALGIFRHRLMGNLFVFAREKGLSMGQFGALMHIFQTKGCGVSDIGTDLGITNSAASQMMERLVQLQLITRSEDPNDRRSKQIVITDKGRQILQEGMLANRKWLESLAASMQPAEQELVRHAVEILVDKAQQFNTNTN
jgi:DNA-binding MarR family transcriptional regulator